MIAGLRALLRLGAVGIYLAGLSLVHSLGRPFARGRRAESWRRRLLGGGCRGCLALMGVRVRVRGGTPSTPGFLVSNHLSYLDVLVLGAVVDAVFVSRADVSGWPGIGRLARWSGTLFLDRRRTAELPSVVAALRSALDRRAQVVFFPEGTSGSGHCPLPFRSSLFEAPCRTGAPVRVAVIHYRVPPSAPAPSRSVCWWGDMEFLPHLWRLAGLPWVEAEVHFLPGTIRETDRKAMSRTAEAAVRKWFRPLDVESSAADTGEVPAAPEGGRG